MPFASAFSSSKINPNSCSISISIRQMNRARKTRQTNQSLRQKLSPFSRFMSKRSKSIELHYFRYFSSSPLSSQTDQFHADFFFRLFLSLAVCLTFFLYCVLQAYFFCWLIYFFLYSFFGWCISLFLSVFLTECYASFAMQNVHSIPLLLVWRAATEYFDIYCCWVVFFFLYASLSPVCVLLFYLLLLFLLHILKAHKKCENVTDTTEEKKQQQPTTTKISVMYL